MVDDSVQGSERSRALEQLVRDAAADVQSERVRFYQEFLLAKAQGREGRPISDKMAEAMAVVATNDELTIADAEFAILSVALVRESD